jgi:hypothetical protein
MFGLLERIWSVAIGHNGAHPNAYLTFSSMRLLQLKYFEHFRTAEFSESNRAHPRHLHS